MTDTPPAPLVPPTDRIHDHSVEKEMHKSYIDYAMSVIVGRALPDGRDGLKPVHRRILWSMWESGATHDRPYRKSARTVGDVLGKYHPHGDLAVYDALVRMAQSFSLRYPLIDGQGNFGSIDGDSPAAMRYTEARLSPIAEEMLADIEKETVDWTENFDGTLKEPLVLPSKVPNLLLNGSAGIAVGMATNMPPHNLGEVIDGLLLLLGRPEATLDDLIRVIPGPDFPTGGYLSSEGIREAYETGRGTLHLRGSAEIHERDGRDEIIINETPYEVNKASLLELIADLVKNKRIDGITDLRDESDRHGTRVVLELRLRRAGRDRAQPPVRAYATRDQLRRDQPLPGREPPAGPPPQVAPRDPPRPPPLDPHQADDLRPPQDLGAAPPSGRVPYGDRPYRRSDQDHPGGRRTPPPPSRASWADSSSRASRRRRSSTCDSPGSTALEREAVESEKAEKEALARHLREILADPKLLDGLIADELKDLKSRFGDPRRTRIVPAFTARTLEDLIPDTEVVVLVTRDGYIKRLPLEQYRRQRRGGRGLGQIETKEEDFVIRTFVTRTHDDVLFFTTLGRVYQLKAYELPEGSRQSKGKAVINLLPKLKSGERVQTLLPIHDLAADGGGSSSRPARGS